MLAKPVTNDGRNRDLQPGPPVITTFAECEVKHGVRLGCSLASHRPGAGNHRSAPKSSGRAGKNDKRRRRWARDRSFPPAENALRPGWTGEKRYSVMQIGATRAAPPCNEYLMGFSDVDCRPGETPRARPSDAIEASFRLQVSGDSASIGEETRRRAVVPGMSAAAALATLPITAARIIAEMTGRAG